MTPSSTHGTLPTKLLAERKNHRDALGILPPVSELAEVSAAVTHV
jgi:hypothetical protein